MADTDPDFAYAVPFDPELRPFQFDPGMHKLIGAIEDLGCSEELTAVVVIASEQYDRIKRMKAKWQDLVADADKLRAALEKILPGLEEEPVYHTQGMGCGLEDRDIVDRYDAMAHGWEKAVERYQEIMDGLPAVAREALRIEQEMPEPGPSTEAMATAKEVYAAVAELALSESSFSDDVEKIAIIISRYGTGGYRCEP